MKVEKDNFYIITGGPGSGKSTLVQALKNQGFLTVAEAGRQIIQAQVSIEGDALHWKDQKKFCDLMLALSIYTYEQMMETNHPVFFDRGIPDLLGYCHLIKTDVPNYIRNAIALFRYNPQVFITPPWEAIYHHDKERKQDWQEAIATYEAIANAYRETGYQLIELPKCSVQERVEFILSHVT